MRKRTITTVVITGTTVLASVVTVGGTASAHPPTRAIAHTKPAWASHAQHLGRAKSSHPITARVYLAPKGGLSAVADFATAAATPGSSSYHKFLSAAQYYARFGATGASANKVADYLRSSGLKIVSTAPHNRYVSVRGTVSQAEKAFGTTLENFKHDGQTVEAPTSNVVLPSSVADGVLTVTGLDTTPTRLEPASATSAPPPAGTHNARPCSTYFGQIKAKYEADYKTPLPKFNNQTLPYDVCGYTGPQFRAAYEGGSKLDGTGVTVGIVDAYASPTIAKDANTYAVNNGDGAYAAGQLTQTAPGSFNHQKLCGPSGWYGEETLDVEAVHAMAPGANIHYYGGASCTSNGLNDALQQVVDDNDVSIVSNSYGDGGEEVSAGLIQVSEQIFLQAASEGISVLFSSGDDGDNLAATGIKSPSYEASDPYVTAVGGTSTAIGADGSIKWQTGWGTQRWSLSKDGKSWVALGTGYGGGGGQSTLFNQPSYQAAVTTNAYRQVPDVAMNGDPNTGMLVGETQTFADGVHYDEYDIGGTSLSSPLFAGMTALSLQSAKSRAGFLNPVIYQDSTADFIDVKGKPPVGGAVFAAFVNGVDASDGVTYNLRTFGQDFSLKLTKGYDQVTGVGVPSPKWLTALGGTLSS